LYRAYSADLGRWISRDPSGERGGINLYDYVVNNPIARIDSLGLWDEVDLVLQGETPEVFQSNTNQQHLDYNAHAVYVNSIQDAVRPYANSPTVRGGAEKRSQGDR